MLISTIHIQVSCTELLGFLPSSKLLRVFIQECNALQSLESKDNSSITFLTDGGANVNIVRDKTLILYATDSLAVTTTSGDTIRLLTTSSNNSS